MAWNPAETPDATTWLALDGASQREAIAQWHADHPSPELHRGSRPAMHANLHAVIESQIAADAPPATGAAVARLMEAGLHRHVVLHAAMEILVQQMSQAMKNGGFDDEGYARDLDALDAATVLHRALGG